MKKVSRGARLASLGVLAAGVAASGVALAHGGPDCGGGRGGAAQFEKMDANKDDKVTLAELSKHKQDWFASVDANKDGVVAEAELAKARAAKHAERRTRMFENQDANKDGKLSAAEFRGPAHFFAQADANKDGAVTREELGQATAHRGKGGAGRWIEHLDQNGDAKVTKDEVTSGASRMLERLDANKDGALSREELARKGGKRGHGRHPSEPAPREGGSTRS